MLYTDEYLDALASGDLETIERCIEEANAQIMARCNEARSALKQALRMPRRMRVAAYSAWLKTYDRPINFFPDGTTRSYRGCRYAHKNGVFYTYVWGELQAFSSLRAVCNVIRLENGE